MVDSWQLFVVIVIVLLVAVVVVEFFFLCLQFIKAYLGTYQ